MKISIPARITPQELSDLDEDAFVRRFGGVFEHATWVAHAAWRAGPFPGVEMLHRAMLQIVMTAPPSDQLALLRAHPELAAGGPLTVASAAEQKQAGLTSLDTAAAARFAQNNRVYRAKFGFPFIVAVRGQRDPRAIELVMQQRLANTPELERRTALEQVAMIARFRLQDLVDE